MSRVLDLYYKRPLLYDILINIIIIGTLFFLDRQGILQLDFDETSTNVGSVGLTISGFILTLLTILLTLKSNAIIKPENITSGSNAFQVFLASNLYKKSIAILKNAVVILLFVSFSTLATSVLSKTFYQEYGFYINTVCLLFILLTFLRCFHILNLILEMQNNNLK